MRNSFLNKNSKDFIALVPAYNEAGTIGQIIAEIKNYLDKVIVVDDGSLDNTREEAEKAGAIVLKHNKNLGKGAALKTGFEYILKNFPETQAVITLDADGQHNPNEIPKFIEAFNKTGADLILGERLINRTKMPFLRRAGNTFFSWLISLRIGQKISDSQTGFRLISKRFLEKSNFKSDSYGIETEVLLSAPQDGFQIKTIPTSTIYLKDRKRSSFLKDIKIITSIFREIV